MAQTEDKPVLKHKSWNMHIVLEGGGPKIIAQFDAIDLKSAVKELFDYLQKHHPSVFRAIRREGSTAILSASDALDFTDYRIAGTERWGSGGRTFCYTAIKKGKR